MAHKITKNQHSLVTPNDLAKFVMQPSGWTETLPLLHDKFLIHRIENYRKDMKMPVPPHRKSVFDFIFLTQGVKKPCYRCKKAFLLRGVLFNTNIIFYHFEYPIS